MTVKSLCFLVVSDLHAHPEDPKLSKDSYYSTQSIFSSPADNPLTGIAAVVKKSGKCPDWIICPGDLGDRGNIVAQREAWEQLERIRVEIGAVKLIGAVGNHDIDSRRKLTDYDPKGTLQILSPEFPIRERCFEDNDRVYSDRHWSKNFVIIPFGEYDCNLLIINSCGFHGFASESQEASHEHLHGKLSPLTLTAIKRELGDRRARLNILLVHHHPRKHPWIDDAGSVMAGGDKLIEALKETEQQWLIIHGHQHVPHLSYADATPYSPVILSAASVAAKTYPVRGQYPRNQIHLVEIPVPSLETSGAQLLGTVMSWSWAAQLGWQEAGLSKGLPFRTGFGHHPDLIALRNAVVDAIKASAHGSLSWSKLSEIDPKIDFMVPDDHDGLLSYIKRKGVRITYNERHEPEHLEMTPE
jgi:predicted phosphodiesterase